MGEWNYGMMECWVKKNLLSLPHYSIIPTFQYSKGV